MQHNKILGILLLTFASSMPLTSLAQARQDTLPFTHKSFMAQKELQTINASNTSGSGLNAYRLDNKFYLEIPRKALGRDILVTVQEVMGFSGSVVPSSGVVRFQEGKDIHSLFLLHNRSIDVECDSTDANIMEAIRMSGMLPISQALTVVCRGEDNSYIVDISQDVNSTQGIFNTSKSSISMPDPSRSEITDVRGIDGGVKFCLYRSQTQMMNTSMAAQSEVASTRHFEFLIQLLPVRKVSLKLNSPFYGFTTFSRQEYDSKTYVSRRREYLSRWDLSPDKPVTVFISPVVPKPFAERIRKAFEEWTPAFASAGIRSPFRFTSDECEANLSYHHIYVAWGGASGPQVKLVTDDLTGEIVCARINANDRFFEEMNLRYFTLCRQNDRRIAKDLMSFEVRKDVFQALMAKAVGEVLGLKSNSSGNNAFTPSDLRSRQFVAANGIGASVTDELVFNYIAQPSDGIGNADLLPKVSTYDREAIQYAYGKSKKAPSKESLFYTYVDHMKEFDAPKRTLSSNWIEAAQLGIRNIARNYASLDADMKKLPADQANYHQEHSLILNSLGEYQQLVENVAGIVGYCRQLPIERGVNEHRNHFATREEQLKAVNFLKDEILEGVPAWSDRPELKVACEGNISDMMRAIAVAVYKKWLKKDVIARLALQETELGSKAYTAKELFSFIDHNLLCDFDKSTAVPEYKRLLMANILPDLANNVFSSDLSLGMTDEGGVLLHDYFMHVAKEVKRLAEEHTDEATRENYKLIEMRFNRQYFNKQH